MGDLDANQTLMLAEMIGLLTEPLPWPPAERVLVKRVLRRKVLRLLGDLTAQQ